MPLNEKENALGKAIEQLVKELGLSSPNQLWDEANETDNRATWYRRIAPGRHLRTTEKQITKLIDGLEQNGHMLSRDQKDRLYISIGVKVVRQEELDRIQRLEALKDSDRQRLLDARLARFVPGTRSEEITKVYGLIEQLKSSGGYLAITGRAGEGKTTLVAQIIASHRFGYEYTPYHIIPFNPGVDHQVTLLHSLMASLALKHAYLSDFWTQVFHRDALVGIFVRMLEQISVRGEQEVLFIDGLDQIRPDADLGERDLAFLPLEVPQGIVLVVSTRPDDVLKPLQLRSSLFEYGLPKLKLADAHRILARQGIYLESFLVEQLYQVTQQNALYMDLVAKELKSDDTSTISPEQILKRISSNPENIFSFSVDRLGYPDKSDWKRVIKPVLGLLLATQEPISTSAMGHILGLEDEDLRSGLQRLGGLIEEDSKGRRYLFHLKLKEYLKEDKSRHDKGYIISEQEERLQHIQLADWCAKNDPGGGRTIWKDTANRNEQERRLYARQYYILHLYHAQEWQQLFAVLDEGVYGQAKLQHDSNVYSYAQDLDLGRQAAAWEEWEIEEGVAHLPHLWRYTLLASSLASRADQYPEEVFRFLILINQKRKAIGMAELLTQPVKKVSVLLRIAEQLRTDGAPEEEWFELFTRASNVAWSIEDSTTQTYALCSLIKPFTLAHKWHYAEELVRFIKQGDEKNNALFDLVEALAQTKQWEQAERKILSIHDSGVQAKSFSVLGKELALARQRNRAEEMWAEARRIIHNIDDVIERDEAISEFGVALALAGQWKQAKQLIPSIQRGWRKVKVLSCVIKSLALSQHKSELEATWSEISEVILESSEASAGSALAALMISEVTTNVVGYGFLPALRDLSEAATWTQQWEWAEKFIEGMYTSDEKTEAVCNLVRKLAQVQQWERAKEVLYTLDQEKDKVLALCGLGEILVEARKWEEVRELWLEIEHLVRATENWLEKEEKREALANLSRTLAQAQRWEWAENVIHGIEPVSTKIRSLLSLGQTLVQIGRWDDADRIWEQAGELIDTVEQKDEKAQTLCSLGESLAQTGYHERAEEIWVKAEDLIRTIEDHRGKDVALVALSSAFAQTGRWEAAIALLPSIEGDGEIEMLWRNELTACLIHAQEWEQVEALIDTIKWSDQRSGTFYDYVEALAQAQQWNRAEQIIHTFEQDDRKIEVLCILGKALAQAQQWERAEVVWAEAKSSIDLLEESQEKNTALVHLSKAFAQVQQWERSKQVIHAIKGGEEQGEALCELGKALALAQQWERADAVQTEIEALALTVAPRTLRCVSSMRDWSVELIEAQRLEQAKRLIDAMKFDWFEDDESQRILIGAFALRGYWEQAYAMVGTVEESDKKVEALCELSKALALDQRWEESNALLAEVEELIYSSQSWKIFNLLEVLVKTLAIIGNDELQLRVVQRAWLSVTKRQDTFRLLQLAFRFIPLQPEIGAAFGEAFIWVDTFFKRVEGVWVV